MAMEVRHEGGVGMRRITVRYANSPAGGMPEENSEGPDHELHRFALAEVLDQESLYQLILDGARNDHTRGARTYAPSHYSQGESSSRAVTSRDSDVDAQIASDEAFARQLQQMEDLSIETSPDEHTVPSDVSSISSLLENSESSDGNDEGEAARQDDVVDPDNLTYEERQALGESVGTESRGLSDELISFLGSWKYKSRFFSKTKHENCVICQSTYKNGKRMITLPCMHYFHEDCIAKWLRINRICPLCKYEVFGPS